MEVPEYPLQQPILPSQNSKHAQHGKLRNPGLDVKAGHADAYVLVERPEEEQPTMIEKRSMTEEPNDARTHMLEHGHVRPHAGIHLPHSAGEDKIAQHHADPKAEAELEAQMKSELALELLKQAYRQYLSEMEKSKDHELGDMPVVMERPIEHNMYPKVPSGFPRFHHGPALMEPITEDVIRSHAYPMDQPLNGPEDVKKPEETGVPEST